MSVEKYNDTRRREKIYNRWAKKSVSDDIIPPVEFTNDDRSYIEVIDFIVNRPDRYFVYVDEQKMVITNWMGKTLGKIITMGGVVNDNFGGQRRYIHVEGINDVMYWGWYYCSSGDYARIQAYKDQ